MKKTADLFVTMALACIVLLLQAVQAEGQELPGKCTAPAGALMKQQDQVFNFKFLTANHLLQTPNPIDDTRFFVKQHYRDFLVREPPDNPGWDFWSNQITACGTDAACIDAKRVDVSRAFFFDGNFVAYSFPINPNLSQPRGTAAYNNAFVRQCFITYLRREPNAPPDNNLSGFNFWLGVLNSYGSPTPDAGYNHLIRAFLLSSEYRNRFVAPPC
ncbi:MAG TPA: hypothetical protein VFI24_27950 [Pyrinomonadaceae bacterium]|nr:hypothetical protein [Pyrinomonadaceae bacterium]